MSDTQPIDLVVTFDTTGSMYPCLTQVRRTVDALAARMFREIPNLRIGVIAHGDYCDARTAYVTKHLALTNDPNAVSYFIKNVEATYGGDAPECYELVLHEAQSMQWRDDAKRLLVMIGDDIPHPPAHNPKRLDWRTEVQALTAQGVLVHGVQCLNRHYATAFYKGLSDMTGGFHLNLNQFAEASDMLLAVAYQQQSPEALDSFEQEIVTNKKMTRGLSDIFARLRRDPTNGRYREVDARAVDPSRFQQIPVLADEPIRDLVQNNGLPFVKGRGFYEFTKRETIQAKKEVIILDQDTGDMYEGAAAREVLGLPTGTNIDISPTFDRDRYKVFVQSTSVNRALKAGTTFLYETA